MNANLLRCMSQQVADFVAEVGDRREQPAEAVA
jgi:hypothetical protein